MGKHSEPVVWESTLECRLGWECDLLPVDIDVTGIMYDSGGALVDAAYFNQLSTQDQSLELQPLNPTSQHLLIHTDRVQTNVQAIAIVLHAYKSKDFFNVVRTTFTVISKKNNFPVVAHNLASKGEHSALIIGVFYRDFETYHNWHFKV
jgi:stress response protein SCP2